MVVQRSIGLRTLTLCWQLVLVSAGFWVWLFIWHDILAGGGTVLFRYLLYNEFLLVGVLFGSGAGRTDHHPHAPQHEWVRANHRTIRQTFLGLFCVFLILFLARDGAASRSFFISYIPFLYITLLFSNYLLPRSLGRWAFSGVREERVALAGTAEQAARLKPWLERKSLVGFRTIGLVSSNADQGDGSPFPILGGLDQTASLLREHRVTQLLILDLSLGSGRLRQLAQLCEEGAVRLVARHDLNSYFNHATTTFEDEGVRFIGLREEPLESPLNRLAKRALDLAVATPVVVLILPFTTLAVWCLQRLQSPGPVFFRQVRNGMMGRPFWMSKYRTMHVHHGDEARQATRNDDRVFPAGRWLRRLSIDELPQFINVLKGDMSVVGPRPHLPRHEEMFVQTMRRYVVRRFIHPGITGWAQVNGHRGEIHSPADIERRVEADIYYLENWSFSLDCLILIKTLRHCVAPPGSAY